jgi:LDH2 family malate/lactate/ureidoglycolate dehydrogenase
VRITAEAARDFALAVLGEAGMGEADTQACADLLVESSLRGVDSHGVVAQLSLYVEHARHGIGAPGRAPAVVERHGAIALVEAAGASGPRTARFALEAACDLAEAHGVGCAVARLGYFGALWWSVHPAAARGLVALATVDAAAFVAPHGGVEALHGTNPIAVAIPHEPDPILLDMRTNTFRMADYWESIRTGRPLPEGALRTPDGSPLTDPDELEAGLWTTAVSLPLAAEKGYGLALVVDVLTAALAGTPIGRELVLGDEETALAAFFLAIDPSAFGPRERFADAVGRLAAQVHATTPLDPAAPVRLPGERSAAERRRRLADGIPVDEALWSRLVRRLEELGVSGVPADPALLAEP